MALDHQRSPRRSVFRHPPIVRITHWINVVCIALLLMSGLQIFNAHPALYWGISSEFDRPVLSITAQGNDATDARGITTVLGYPVGTTGLLGLSRGANGELVPVAFPHWITVPADRDLATGRRWHFLFAWLFVANGLSYLVYTIVSCHLREDLMPTVRQLRTIPSSIMDHLRLRFPKGEEALHYNVLQKLSYLAVIFVLLPVLVFAGLTMSPGMNTAFPELLTLFGGRQSARTVHFIAAFFLVVFIVVHVAMVLLSGFWNNLRSMVTGRYAIKER